MRVLLLAEDCNPEWPSLPIVGYQMVKALSRVAKVTLATHIRNRKELDGQLPDTEVTFMDNEYVAAPLYRIATWVRRGNQANWSTAVASAYPGAIAFDHEVHKHFKRRLNGGEFDVVHRLTPMSPALPSPMASWSPVPFVLGPLNGGLPWPEEFRAELVRERERLRGLRQIYKLLPYHRSTFRDAAAILTSFDHTLADLPASAHVRCIDFPEVGVAPELFQNPGERPERPQLTFISVGRFVPLKLLDVAIRVFATSPKLRAHKLVLVGDGMERPALEKLVADLGLQQVVEFAGWMNQSAVAARLREADVFFFPSIRELGGGVVVEAMACGCVPVVVNYGGPGGLISGHDCGVAVPLGDKEQLIPRLVEVLERYVDDRELRLRHSRAAYQRAIDHFSWDAKARKVLEVYEWVTGRRSLRPRFGEPDGSPRSAPAGAARHVA
ncbi:MAG TPA: glycosyltransferase [Polyangiaceae bacterium]|nr:glycosyltransferase [Polyangiaceae bacterium]